MTPILAQEAATRGFSLADVLQPEILVFCIPVVAIVFGSLVAIVKTLVRHRERIAMIEAGFDPDAHAHAADAE